MDTGTHFVCVGYTYIWSDTWQNVLESVIFLGSFPFYMLLPKIDILTIKDKSDS